MPRAHAHAHARATAYATAVDAAGEIYSSSAKAPRRCGVRACSARACAAAGGGERGRCSDQPPGRIAKGGSHLVPSLPPLTCARRPPGKVGNDGELRGSSRALPRRSSMY
eukprot:scaffold141629_cov63-Phaeocystis_antarctica.AAC.1